MNILNILQDEFSYSRKMITASLLFIKKYLLLLLLIAEIVIFSVMSKHFLTINNLLNIGINTADLGLIAAGLTLVILMGGIDVSLGYAVGLIGWFVATGINDGIPSWIVLSMSILLGVALSLFNGTLTVKLKVPSIVATLGTSAIFQTMLFALWGSKDVMVSPVFPWLSGNSRIAGVPTVVLLVIMVYILLHIVLKRTVFGRNVYAVGSNPEAARLVGIPVNKIRLASYAILGVLVGIAACLYSARLGVIQASSGNELTMLSIASVVVGGTSVLGGEGSVLRTLGGLIFIAVLQNGVVLIGVPSLWTGVLIGFFIVIAVSVNGLVLKYLGRER